MYISMQEQNVEGLWAPPILVWAPLVYGGGDPYRFIVLGGQSFFPGTPLRITCDVFNLAEVDVRVKVNLNIHQGSGLPYPGDLLASYTSPEQTIPARGTRDYLFEHTTMEAGGRADRDFHVRIMYWAGSEWMEWGNVWKFDGIYHVSADYDFDIGRPTVQAA